MPDEPRANPAISAASSGDPPLPLRSRASRSRRKWAAGLLVASAAIAFGWPTRHGAFLFGDDHRLVADHYLVNHPSTLHALELFTTVHEDLYQPLPMLTFQLNYALAAARPAARPPISARGFHFVNIALHAVNAVLAFLLASRLAGCGRVGLLTGLMFACHPFALEAVAWISGRMMLMASCFALIVMLNATRGSDSAFGPWTGWTLLAWVASLLSKVMPTVPIAAAWCDVHVCTRPTIRRSLIYAIALGLGGAAAWAALRSTGGLVAEGALDAEDVAAVPVRHMLAARYYLENYGWPARLAPWSPPTPSEVTISSSQCVVAIVEIALFVATMLCAWRHDRTAFLGLGIFVLLLTPFLAAMESRRLLTADRYMYLPILGLHLAVASIAIRAVDSLRQAGHGWIGRGMLASGAAIMLAVWMAIGWELSGAYADSIQRDTRVAVAYPDSPEAQAELARSLIATRDIDAALAVINQSRARWPNHPRLAARAGEAYLQRKDWASAVAELEPAVRAMPRHTPTRYLLALALEKLGSVEDARSQYVQVLEQDDDNIPALLGLARVLAATRQSEEAIRQYHSVLRINPRQRDALLAVAAEHIHLGRFAEARPLLDRILADDPLDANAKLSLGIVLAKSGDLGGALAIYNELIDRQPKAPALRLNRAEVLKSLHRWDEAEADYRAVLNDHPNQPDAADGLRQLDEIRHNP